MPIRTQLRGAAARLLLVLVLIASSAATGLSPADAPVGSPSPAVAKDGKKNERAKNKDDKGQSKTDGKGKAKDKDKDDKRRGKGAKAALDAQRIAAANADSIEAMECGNDLIALRVDDRVYCTHGEDPEPPAGESDRQAESAAEPETGAQSATVAPRALCIDDGVSGPRVQMVYVHRQDRPNRLDELLPTFRRLAAEMDTIVDQSARKTGGSLRVRFVTDANCRVDVRSVSAAPNAISGFGSLIQRLDQAGYDDLDRKYLMMVDASVFCGVGTYAGGANADDPDTSAHDFTGYARVDVPCWDAGSMAHEISHTLGAVQDSAPNSSRGGHCVDEWDVMCYSDEPYKPKMRFVCDGAQDFRLDCGDDDYFAARPRAGSYLARSWNMADSQYLTTGSGPTCADARQEPDDAFWYDYWKVPMPAFQIGHDQPRAFCSEPGDTDWALIRAKAGETYRIETTNLAPDVDTRLVLYRGFEEQRWDGMAEFGANDDRAEGDPSSAITFTAPANGSFLVGIAEVEGRAGFDQTYTLAIDKIGSVPAPPLSLSRSSGKPGVAFTVTVRGLNAAEAVAIWRQRNGQSVKLGDAVAGVDGTANATFTVPRGLARGTYQIEAVTDNRSAATAPFTVLDTKDGKQKGKSKGKAGKKGKGKRGGKGKR